MRQVQKEELHLQPGREPETVTVSFFCLAVLYGGAGLDILSAFILKYFGSAVLLLCCKLTNKVDLTSCCVFNSAVIVLNILFVPAQLAVSFISYKTTRLMFVRLQVQTRSADEPMTTFVLCNECGNRWKVSSLTFSPTAQC